MTMNQGKLVKFLALLCFALVSLCLSGAAFATPVAPKQMTGYWLVHVDGEKRDRVLQIDAVEGTGPSAKLTSKYGWADEKLSPLAEATLSSADGTSRLHFVTNANSTVDAVYGDDTSEEFIGTISYKNGSSKKVHLSHIDQEEFEQISGKGKAAPPSAKKLPAFPMLTYGNPNAKIKVLIFMSSFCVDCMYSFRNVLNGPVKEQLVDTGKAYVTIMPFAMDDGDVNFATMLTCSKAGFAKSFEWHMTNGSYNDWRWTLEHGNAEAGLGIPAPGKCKQRIAVNSILLNIRDVGTKTWGISALPYYVIGGKGYENPSRGQVRSAIEKLEKQQ